MVGGELKGMEDPNFYQFWRVAKALTKVRNRALILRDVKNEGTTGDVYENKGDDDKMSCENPSLCTKMHELGDD